MSPTGGTVFLLDDEPGMVKALTRLLKAEGFTVRATAANTEPRARAGAVASSVSGGDGLSFASGDLREVTHRPATTNKPTRHPNLPTYRMRHAPAYEYLLGMLSPIAASWSPAPLGMRNGKAAASQLIRGAGTSCIGRPRRQVVYHKPQAS